MCDVLDATNILLSLIYRLHEVEAENHALQSALEETLEKLSLGADSANSSDTKLQDAQTEVPRLLLDRVTTALASAFGDLSV